MNALPDHLGLPHEPDCEASVLGGILLDNAVLDDLQYLEVEHFWDMRNRVVFAAMRNLVNDGRPIDVVLLEAEIQRSGKSEAVGGIAYLGELTMRVPTADNVREYAKLILRAYRNRQVQVELAEATARVRRGVYDPDDVLDETVGELQRLQESAKHSGRSSGPDRYGVPIIEFLGDEEPSSDPSEVFDVHGLIVTKEPSLMIGPAKIGKTMTAEDLMLHVAAGRSSWCDVPIYRRARVLLFLREDSERTSRRRLWQLARGSCIRHDELAGYLSIDVRSPLYFDDPKHIRKLEACLVGFDICMIDSLSTIHNGDENSVERMAPVMNAWRDLSLNTGTAIPLIHHFRKDAPGQAGGPAGGVLQRARGSSLIGATTRHAVGFDPGPEKDQIALSCESNHEVDAEPFVIRRVFGADSQDRRFIRHERVGTQRDAREAADRETIDPVVMEVIRAAGDPGLGMRAIRDQSSQRLRDQDTRGRGPRVTKIDDAVSRLYQAGRIDRRVDRNYRAIVGVGDGK